MATVAILVALPVVGTLVYTYHDTLQRSRERVDEVAGAIARQVEDVLVVVEAALADVAFDARLGCGPELIREFRNKTITAPAIQGMGLVIEGSTLACTSYGMVEPAIAVARTEPIRPEGAIIWFAPPATGEYAPSVLVTAILPLRDGNWLVAAFTPELLFGFVAPDVIGGDGRIAVTMKGVELASLGVGQTRASDFLTVVRPAGLYDARIHAYATRAWALAPWRESAILTATLGALAGGALAFGAARIARKHFSLAGELKDGLANGEFEIRYQPTIDLRSGRCAGAEALIRWRHPERDMIPPDLFIALAEETGIIIPMTRWLMRQVGEDLGELLRSSPDLHVGINLAPAHTSNHGIVEDARRIVEAYGIQPRQILFELTERGLMDDPACREVVAALGRLGSEVAVDDFGTGYSSLAYIDKFKLDYLKIDKAFVSAIGTRSPSVRLTNIIIEMATSLGLKTIAEGVETAEQARYLRDHGVVYAQGWYFSKALTKDGFLAFVAGWAPVTAPAAREA